MYPSSEVILRLLTLVIVSLDSLKNDSGIAHLGYRDSWSGSGGKVPPCGERSKMRWGVCFLFFLTNSEKCDAFSMSEWVGVSGGKQRNSHRTVEDNNPGRWCLCEECRKAARKDNENLERERKGPMDRWVVKK